jgi:hypothetical protein
MHLQELSLLGIHDSGFSGGDIEELIIKVVELGGEADWWERWKRRRASEWRRG